MGILITYQWQIEGHANDGTIAHVVLNPLPNKLSHSSQELRNVILRHPQAPATVQEIIDYLDFAPEPDFQFI